MKNKKFLECYLFPMSIYSNLLGNVDFKNEQLKRVNQFMSANESIDLPAFIERAKNVFGDEAEAYNKIIQYEMLKSINKKLHFFFVIAIISIIIGFISGLSMVL